MQHLEDSPRYLCSELVSILYEDRQRQVHQTTANLEDISSGGQELRREVMAGSSFERMRAVGAAYATRWAEDQ